MISKLLFMVGFCAMYGWIYILYPSIPNTYYFTVISCHDFFKSWNLTMFRPLTKSFWLPFCLLRRLYLYKSWYLYLSIDEFISLSQPVNNDWYSESGIVMHKHQCNIEYYTGQTKFKMNLLIFTDILLLILIYIQVKI